MTQIQGTTVRTVPATTVIREQHGGVVTRFFGFIGWVLTGFGLFGMLAGRKSTAIKSDEIVLHSVHRAFFLWFLILTGFIGAFCVRHIARGHGVWAWIYVFVLLATIVSILFDVSTLKALLWGGIYCFIWITSKYLEETKHIVMLSAVKNYLHSLSPVLDPGMASVMSWLLLIPWIGSLFVTFSRGKKVFSPNSIEEYFLGEGREILDRSGLKFRTVYRDVLESLLGFGSGDIEAIDNNQHVVKRWENILFLVVVWPKLDEILHQRAATVDNAPTEPVEVEEVKKTS